jgi:cation transport regulator ChaB
MPMTKKSGKPKKSELPSTLQNSGKKAQRTFAKAHDAAAEEYGEGERAHRVAYSALKHKFDKVGDHKGTSDERARRGGPNTKGQSDEGVNANSTKKRLTEVARTLDIPRRSTMNKDELVTAIKKANRRETARNR